MAWELTGNSGTNAASNFLGTTDGKPLIVQPGAGNVGIGSRTPQGKLEVNGNWDEQHSVGALTLAGDKPTIRFSGGAIAGNQQWILHEGSDGPGDLQFFNGGTTGAFSRPVLSLTPDGNVVVTGDIRLANADCAEDFEVASAEPVEPGTVMVLGDEDTLQPSQHAYDKRVVGVISGAGNYKPGIVLDRQSRQEKRSPVALLGKVFCKVDARYAPIEVGDLLTTSDTTGHAMKATDPAQAFGSVIGKVLRPLLEGQGLIPVLIALQ
ncbi:MAG TPA: hypothetical protein VLW44_08955 [Streptosporangiaceae bacterium]|nr:hypothetical protein [Streptosporangiaceae bacterium]